MLPLISVIIPTYNRAHTLERALKSVLAQDYPNFELIVVDDASGDETSSLLEKYAADLKIIKLDENKGVSYARNRGVEMAKGEWIAFLDSDDEWLVQKLSVQMKYIQDNPHFKIVHNEEIWIRKGKRVNAMKKHKKGGGDQFLPSLNLCLISPSCVLLKKSLFDEMKGFREDFPVCEDYDLWLKITSLYEVGFISTPLVQKHGGHADQLSHSRVGLDYWRILSLAWIFENRNLSAVQNAAVLSVLKEKAEIYLIGAQKRGVDKGPFAKQISSILKSLAVKANITL